LIHVRIPRLWRHAAVFGRLTRIEGFAAVTGRSGGGFPTPSKNAWKLPLFEAFVPGAIVRAV